MEKPDFWFRSSKGKRARSSQQIPRNLRGTSRHASINSWTIPSCAKNSEKLDANAPKKNLAGLRSHRKQRLFTPLFGSGSLSDAALVRPGILYVGSMFVDRIKVFA